MVAYLVRRLAFLIFVMVGVTLLIFVISSAVPADPARAAAGLDATQAQVEALRERLGLDQPLHVQYGRYLLGLLQGDFGRSSRSLGPIADDLKQYLPATIELVLVTMIVYVALGVPLGVISAMRRNSLIDRMTRLVMISGIAMPEFWLALIVQIIFFGQLQLLPSSARLPTGMEAPRQITGMYTVDSVLTGDWPALGASLKHLILPVAVLALRRIGVLVRITRRSMLSIMNEDFVRTARAKGLSERAVTWRHVFRNALLPIITIIGLQTGWLINSAVVVEMVFAWPGLGWYAAQSIQFWDYFAVMSVALVVSVAFVLINMVMDLTYVMVDPRVRE